MEIRNCNKCNDKLVIGDNWYAASKKNLIYKCNTCRKNNNKKWAINNPDRKKQLIKDWQDKHLTDIPAGIYGIIKNKKIIYIGESKKPLKRAYQHFSNANIPNNSVIAIAIGSGELKREDLSFMMLEYIDDSSTRKKRERELIRKEKPKYNKEYLAT